MSHDTNPYASPVAADLVIDAVGGHREIRIASQGKRFLNLIIDNIVVQVISTVAGFVLGLVFALSRVAANQAITPQDETLLQVLGFFVGLAVALAYYTLTEAVFHRTLAKFLTGTIVVTEEGLPPTLGQIFGRSCARFIPFEAFSFLGGNQPVGWHDSLSKTRVISLR